MSYSRLEKFIYAICSMEVTDLPVPLSRIEKLWNCLITGETPDFEPLSRNEKYLMAMLDRYDISNLPAPMSRGEKLLYKIAVGETDLSDVPGYLSRYEELLKYLIENGGIGGGDFEYVLHTFNQSMYTLYTTAEKPVKKAVIYGDTLVNTLQEPSSLAVTPIGEDINAQQATVTGTANGAIQKAALKGQTLVNLVPNRVIDYIATSNWDGFNALGQNSNTQGYSWKTLYDLKPKTKYLITCYVETFEVDNNEYYLLNNQSDSSVFGESLRIYTTGLHRWVVTSKSEFTEKINAVLRCQNAYARGAIKIRDIMIIEYQQDGMENWDIPYFEGMQSVKMPVLATSNEDGTKSSILSTLENVTLCSIDDTIRDELNLMTGEYTKEIYEYTFTGDEAWGIGGTSTGYSYFRLTKNNLPIEFNYKYDANIPVVCNRLPKISYTDFDNGLTNVGINLTYTIRLNFSDCDVNNGATVEDLRAYLKANPTTILYPIKKSIKTVPLTVQDQDGNVVPHLQAFNETTHITTSSTGLFPNVVIPATVSYPSIIKPRTLYTVKLKRSVTSGTLMINVGGTEQAVTSDCFTLTTPSTLTSQDVIFSGKGNVISEVTVVEGDQTAKEYGYFEGMQSVKMPSLTITGKNLFNPNETKPGFFYDKAEIQEDYHELFPCLKTNNLKPNTKYTVSARYSLYIAFFDKNEISLGYFDTNTGNVLTTPNNTYYTLLRSHKSISSGIAYNSLDEFKNDVQIEEGSIATSYEPYKSNILTVNEDATLRKVGDVRDELDAKTGEVIERVGEIMLDGSEKWTIHSGNNWQRYSTEIPSMIDIYDFKNSNRTHCDKLAYDINDAKNSGSYLRAHKNIVIYNNEIVRDIEQFKRWLSRNPITIQYELAESTNKSIDISTVDQDNQPTQLGTFENITHVSLEAENLIPEVEMEVATNLLEDTVFNLMDAFNTLYPTAAKPVVDGTLTGQTLVNISSLSGEITIKPNSAQYIESSLIQQNKTYTFMFDCTSAPSTGTIEIRQILDNTQVTENTINVTQGYNKFKLKTSSKEINKFRLKNPNTSETDFVFNNLLIIEGDYTNEDIPYFEGMQSVQAPGVTMTNDDATKSITLSTPSDLELRKVGEVQDEMNVMTGEVVERIGKMVLDGSESWSIHSTGTNTVRFVTYDKLDNLYYFGENTNMFTYIMCDTFSPVESNASTDTEGLQIYSNKNGRSDLKLRILNTKASTIDELKAYLTQHPITIQYRAKENTKTINLTIRNQDGNETKLTTFDDTTHVLLESEAGPNPGASLTVRTKIPSASSTSLLIDDISTDQQQLESTVNEQSNNVDATMIATTEIYEETL